MVVMVGSRGASMQFFRSLVGSGSIEQDVGFAERMIFLKSLSEIRSTFKELRQDSIQFFRAHTDIFLSP